MAGDYNIMRQIFTSFLLALSAATIVQAQHVIDLQGFRLSPHAQAPSATTQWTYENYSKEFFDNPQFAPWRADSSFQMPYFLTPKTYFVGEEVYEQTVAVPQDWANLVATLVLERVHIVSHVFVNGVEATALAKTPQVGKGCRSLAAPHCYDLTGLLRAGQTDTLRIVVDNRLADVPVGHNSYSVSDDDQGNWNGFIGEARIIGQKPTRLIYGATRIFPSLGDSSATVQMQLGWGGGKKPEKMRLRLRTEAGTVEQPVVLANDSQRVEVRLSGLTRTWDEHRPQLYHLRVELLDKKGRAVDQQQLTFGMREVSADEHFVRINGRRVLLRGTVDGAQFPMTGYPPMDEAFWLEYFRRLKRWGTNLVRFHSWCPPEAAFAAADSVGMYLHVECSSWPNHDVLLTADNATAQYLWQESDQILDIYGNHPSFILLAAGNEPKGRSWTKFAEQWVDSCVHRDGRRLYTAFSVGGSWPWTKNNQVQVRAGWRGVEWDRRRPEGRSDFSSAIDTLKVPLIGHEVGQWGSYPALRDIPKFTGFMRSGFNIICHGLLAQNGMEHLADSFLMASGRLQVVCYKHEMERIRRTRNYGGYELQALADYTGQATANEGILNVFLEPKGYVEPQEWSQWSGEVVPLLRVPKFIYTTADTLRFQLELSNMGAADTLRDVPCSFAICNAIGQEIMRRDYPARDFGWGGGQCFADESVPLASLALTDAAQLKLQVRVGDYRNEWPIWVYPAEVKLEKRDVYVTTVPDDKARQVLRDGGKVLIIGFDQVNLGRNIKQTLLPQFWNHLWVSRYSSHTHGLLIRERHPLFRRFPTAFHSDVQWWELVNRTYPMYLGDMPADLVPLVQTIDNGYKNRRLGMLFEARVGNGRLVMTNLDLLSKRDQRIVARQLLYSILDYMNSDDFKPATEVEFQRIYELFSTFRAL